MTIAYPTPTANGAAAPARYCATCADSSLLNTMNGMLDLFVTAILLCLIIALVTLALAQLLGPFVRALVQARMLTVWHRDASRDQPETVVPGWFRKEVRGPLPGVDIKTEEGGSIEPVFPRGGWHLPLGSISNGHLMKSLQSAATLILARPSRHPREFALLAASADAEDRGTVLALDFLARKNPSLVARLLATGRDAEPPTADAERPKAKAQRSEGFSQAVSAAQDAVGTAAERTLDKIQLGLDGAFAGWSRLLAMAIGAAIAETAALAVSNRLSAAGLVLGIVGGLLASLARDLANGYLSRRR